MRIAAKAARRRNQCLNENQRNGIINSGMSYNVSQHQHQNNQRK